MEYLKRMYSELKKPREFTSLDAINIYLGLAVLFFMQSVK